jgi:hypothetical protein
MIPSLTKLRTDAWRTSSARYNAARRLRRRELFSTVSLALLSAMTVAIAFIQRVYAPPSSVADNYFTALSASLGVFLLTISLVEWGARTGSAADALHQNAEKLNAMQRKIGLQIAAINAGVSVTWNTIQTLSDEYEAIKADCRHNHQPIDDEYFRAKQRAAPEFCDSSGNPVTSKGGAFGVAAIWQLSSVWYFAGLWIVVLSLLVLPLKYTDWWTKPLTATPQTHTDSTKSDSK